MWIQIRLKWQKAENKEKKKINYPLLIKFLG